MDSIPSKIAVRLDEETRGLLATYMAQNQMTLSQAVRVLLALSLRDEGVSPERMFRAAAFREGLVLGVAKITEKLSTATREAMTSALGELRGFE